MCVWEGGVIGIENYGTATRNNYQLMGRGEESTRSIAVAIDEVV